MKYVNNKALRIMYKELGLNDGPALIMMERNNRGKSKTCKIIVKKN